MTIGNVPVEDFIALRDKVRFLREEGARLREENANLSTALAEAVHVVRTIREQAEAKASSPADPDNSPPDLS